MVFKLSKGIFLRMFSNKDLLDFKLEPLVVTFSPWVIFKGTGNYK